VTLVKVCAITDVPEGEAKRFQVDGKLVAVANLGPKGFRAVDAICSHAHFFLDEGDLDVDDELIECPKHGSTFDLNTGAVKILPATMPVTAYAVQTVGDDILIEV
jgi:3-phenylpropionate/trans-cinnamate dioxygenase ferredoxin subunit